VTLRGPVRRKSHRWGWETIFVFLGTNSWHEFTQNNRLEKWTGSSQSGGELFIQARANQRLDRSAFLPHEITHLIIQRFIGDVPLWLNEGIAEFEGHRQRAIYLRTHSPGKFVGLVANVVPRDELIPLSELTGFVDYLDDETKTKTFYLESELLVRYLIVKCGGNEPFLEFLKFHSQGLRFSSALRKSYGDRFENIEVFEEEFAKYASKGKPD
jgi:hypothetical protein